MAQEKFVGAVHGTLLRHEVTGEWRAEISFDPPARRPILGEIRQTKAEASLDLDRLSQLLGALFQTAGYAVRLYSYPEGCPCCRGPGQGN